MFARFQDIKDGALDGEGAINNVERALSRVTLASGEQMSILNRQTGEFKDFSVVISELSTQWDTLTELEQANIVKSVAGVRQREAFLSLMENQAMVTELLAEAEASAGLSADRYSIYLEGLEAAQNRSAAAWEAMWQATVEGDLVKTFYDASAGLADFITGLGGLDEVLESVAIGLGVYAAGMLGAEIASFGLAGALEYLSLVMAANPIGLVAVAVGAVVLAFKSGANAAKEFNDSVEASFEIVSGIEDSEKKFESLAEAIKKASDAYEELNWWQKLFADENEAVSEGIEALLQDVLDSGADFDKYLEQAKKISRTAGYEFEEIGDTGQYRIYKILENGAKDYADAVITLTEAEYEFQSAAISSDRALLNSKNVIREARNEMSGLSQELTSFVYGSVSLTEGEFGRISNMVSETAFSAAEALGITLYDVEGRALMSSANVATAMTEQYISFSNLIQQLGQKDIETAQMVAAAFSSAFGFASGATPYAPVTPTFPKAPSGGGGSGGGTSPEKARIDSQIKSLERKRDAIKDNVDAMKDHIDAQKEALRLQKEEADFLDEIKKKNESLSDIKAEITLLSLDDSEEARAKRLKLEEEAAKLEEEIAEDNADRKYELQVDALEEFQREYEASMEKQMDALDKQIDKLREQSGAISSAGGAASGYADTWQQVGQVQDSVAQSIIDSLKGIGDATDEQRGRVKEYIIELMRAGDSADTVARKAQQALNLMMGVFSLDKAYAQKEDFLLSGKKYHDGGIVEKHHDGGFAGGLKSNEVFSKLLEGEYVATENQMDNFLTKTLPSMIGISPDVIKNFEGDGDVTISMPINIEGNVDDRTLPKIKSITDDVLREINKTLMSKGKIRDAKRYSI